MKKKTTGILCGVLTAVLAVGGLCFWQRGNLRALGMSLQLSQDELAEKMDEQQQRTADAAEKAGIAVRPLTEEERAALQQQELTRDELIDRLTDAGSTAGAAQAGAANPPGAAESEAHDSPSTQAPSAPESEADDDSSAEAPAPPAATDPVPASPEAPAAEPLPAAPAGSEPAPPVSAAPEPDSETLLREELARCIAELYVMEAEYTAWLEQANQSAIDEFVALPEEEQTTSAKYSIGMRYLTEALEKEAECDARMQTLADEIRDLLTQLGEDTALADEIHAAYVDKKAAQKAYYLSLH